MRVAEFRRRLAEAGGVMGVNLVTFHTLYAEILARAGQPRARLLDPVRVRLLRAIVDQLCQEGHTSPLRPTARQTRFYRCFADHHRRIEARPHRTG